MNTTKSLSLVGLGIGIAFVSGCITRGSGSFAGAGPAEPDLNAPGSENPMPAAVTPVQPGNVRYPDPRPAKTPEYWQEHNNPYSGLVLPPAGKGGSYSGASSASSSGSTTYTVKKGDILGRIARQYGVKVADIKAANGMTSDTIRVGQKLKIPAKSAKAGTAASQGAAAAQAADVYVVKKGDILGRIAKQHGVKVADLKAANGLTSDVIREGQKLKIPGKAAAPAAGVKKAEAGSSSKAAGASQAPAKSSMEVSPVVDIAPAMPATPTPPAVEPQAAVSKDEGKLQGFGAAPAPGKTFTYYTNGNEDLFEVTISHMVGMDEAKLLNPQLADEFDRVPARKLPAGTPIILPASAAPASSLEVAPPDIPTVAPATAPRK